MASYNGGGTIMKGGGFLSFDPADTGDRSMPRRKSVAKNSSKKTIQKNTTKKAMKKTASSKVKKPKDPRKLLESARKSLLNLIINQMLSNRPEIKFPDHMHPNLNTAVARFRNPVDWATHQSDFEQIQTKIQLKKERNLRKSARKRMQDEKTPVVLETKRAKTFHKPGSTGSGNPSVGSASANTGEIKTGALRPQKKKSQTAKLGPAGSPKNRTLFIRLLVDRLIQRKASATTPPTTDPILLAEVKEAGGNIPWLKRQPSYPVVVAVRSAALKPAPKPVKNTFKVVAVKEDSTKLSEGQIIKRGQSRIVIHGKRRSSPDMDALIKRVGILPPPPVTPPNKNKKNIGGRITKAQKVWLSAMDRPQKDAWDKLLTKHQQEYVSFGKIHLGTPDEPEKPQKPKVAPLSDVSVSFIIEQLEKKSDDALDPKRIDWGST